LYSLTTLLRNWRVKVVLPYVTGRLLDIGCGNNQLVRSYNGNGTGVDIYDWGDVDLIIDESSNIPFEDSSFDTITVIAALNHIPNRDDLLIEAYRLLSPNGRLIITMIPPRVSFLWHRLRSGSDPDQIERDHHEHELWGINQRDLKQMINKAGFNVQSEIKFMCRINTMTIAKKID
tara:strand:+ start:28126 stop:28653 length:528 start_codon:yes stop_codon:yes gene_type:complete